MNIINEKDDLFLDLIFTDADGIAVVPTSLIYRIDDVLSGERITDNTIVYPTLATHTIAVSSGENSILNPEVGSEERRITLTMFYRDLESVERRKNVEFFYTVNNLRMLETPVLVLGEAYHILTNDSIALVI